MNFARNTILLALLIMGAVSSLSAQERAHYPYANRPSLVSGVTQALFGGFNIEGTWYTERMSFDYSHGFNLDFTGTALNQEQMDQKLEYQIPWTTGFGVGYRVTPFFDIRVEPKLHRYDLFYEDQGLEGDPFASYTTATLGLGAYYRYYPFRKKDNALQGLVIVPNARFWPNIWSSLDNDELSYENRLTEQTEVHSAAQQGIPGTGGFFVNVSVGYTFGGK